MTDGKIAYLRNTDHITLAEFEVLLDTRVLCEDCGTPYQIGDLLKARTCECAHDLD